MANSAEDVKRLRNIYDRYIAHIPHFRVDEAWLRRNEPMVAVISRDPDFDLVDYYLSRQLNGVLLSPNPLFDWVLYDRRAGFRQRSPNVPVELDFMSIGLEHNISPHWILRPQQFGPAQGYNETELAAVRKNFGSDYNAYLNNIERMDRPGAMFSAKFYKTVTGAEGDNKSLLLRYLTNDHIAGVHGTPLFDDGWYRARYEEDMLTVGREPQHRFRSAIEHFMVEGVVRGYSPIPDFDADFYLQAYPDAREAIEQGHYASAIDHFLSDLGNLRRRPNPYFDPIYYLDQHPNVRQEMHETGLLHPLEHFLHVGYKRGYRASPPLINIEIPERFAKAMFERRARLATHEYLIAPTRIDLKVAKPEISVVIPVCNHFAFTASLLLQLASEYGPDCKRRAQVIVVDNGSTDRTTELPALFPGVVYVRTEDPIGYTAACNLGAKEATAPVITFVNNDIELGKGALTAFLDAFAADKEVGVLGGKIVLTDGRTQEAGGLVYANGGTAGFGRGMAPEREVLNIARDVDYVSGCLLAIRSKLFTDLDGFDELFSPGYFEDTDLCLRAWAVGFRVRYLPHAYITHYEYGTYSKGRPKEISFGKMFANKSKYLRKHRDVLQRTGVATADRDQTRGAFRLGGRNHKYVMMIEDLAPDHLFGSGFARSEDVLKEFLDRGWRVTVLAGSRRPGDERFVERYSGRLDLRYLPETSLTELLGEIGGALDLVWVCRTHNLPNFRDLLLEWRRGGEDRRLVADTEALASTRTAFPGANPSDLRGSAEAAAVVLGEIGSAEDFDQIVCVNDHEAQLARAALPVHDPLVLGHRFELGRSDTVFEDRVGFVFCGAVHEAYAPNLDSLKWFCGEILPLIRKQIPDARLDVVGYIREGVDLPEAVVKNATILGRVDDLGPVFDRHRVFVAPTRLAAGVPHKVQQAMALGIPCVATANLADQLELSEDLTPLVSAQVDAAAFADQCVRLYRDAVLWGKVQADGYAEINRKASAETFAAQFDKVMEGLDGQGA
jgi:GT2 family glycosyltransferase